MKPEVYTADAAENQSTILTGPWHITDTVESDRKNLFCLSPINSFHVATIVSGSRSKIDRFERSLSLIRTAPELYRMLQVVLESIRSAESSSLEVSPLLAAEIEAVLERAEAPFFEG